LQAFGITRKLIKLTGMKMNNTKCEVKVQNSLSEESEINRGLRQGDPLSPTLFNRATEQAATATRTSRGGTINNRMAQIMAYADNDLLPARTKAALSGALREFVGEARNVGLRINEEKTKYMKVTRNEDTLQKNIQLMEYEFPTCENFKYLGAVVTEKNDTAVK
jgi:hypothetical protein